MRLSELRSSREVMAGVKRPARSVAAHRASLACLYCARFFTWLSGKISELE